MRGLIAVVSLSLVFVAAWSQSAGAQAEPFGYRPAVELALSEYREGHFEEARAEFRRAHAFFPNARTLRGIGMAEFELRNYGESVTALKEALQSQVRPLEGELRAETERLLARAINYIARVTVELEPATATITIDGALATLGPERLLLLRVGDHVLEFRAEGRVSERRELRINGGEQQTLHIVLNEPVATPAIVPTAPTDDVTPVAAAHASSTTRTTEPAEASNSSPLPWIITGVSAAVLVGGIVLVAMAQSDIAAVEELKDGATWNNDLQSGYDSAPLKSGIGIALIGLGAAGIGAGAYLLMTGSDTDEEGSTQVALGLGSASITGTF